jgi:2-dehydropantoate 2-reductase
VGWLPKTIFALRRANLPHNLGEYMKIAVIGPGALGCLLACFLFEAKEDVVLVDYRPERAALLRERGIQLKTADGDQRIIRVPIALAAEIQPRDLAVMTVKAHQTRMAASALPLLLAPQGLALTLQNGLGNLEDMAKEMGPEYLLAGVAYLGATRTGEGQIIFAGQGFTYIGAPQGSKVPPAKVAEVVEVFRRAGLKCQARENIEVIMWEKLLINVAINPLTALLRVPNGALLELPEAWELAAGAAAEAKAVAQAAGFQITGDPQVRLRRVCTATAANRSSMLQDVLAGKSTEIEALNAQVVKRGRALGIPTPINYYLTQLLRALGPASPFRVR